ncbi:MAG: bifunctional riboflavin kinase/FMN adenylyltransferase [Phycisphaerales bacterium]|nr:bifunctional riboflavin kinase/FMN adenylyltransferase [Phycisphaerales bacterium]MCI0629148.1 bifunctional riboflavin kinase/FMN adenylyltransferase [Phycisphaerales bacterium]MCI0676714.1 bifunctional riboflavin kinase/FMN adenylyltransferase [Phycisphaerales bacterium]
MVDRLAITIGNFDGVHLGHVELIRAARSAVDGRAGANGRVMVLALDPHPLTVLRPSAAPPRLSSIDQRFGWIRQAGADEVIVLKPDADFLSQTAEEFIGRIAEEYSPEAIVEGPDFRFGRGRAGSVETLRELSKKCRFRTIVVDPVEVVLSDQSVVRASSSMARWLIERGRVRDAAMVLGRPYQLSADVVPGDRRGRELGVPTINLHQGDFLLPADGIYSGDATLPNGQPFAAAISVGAKPTFGSHPRVCEAHLLGYSGPLDDYGWKVQLDFHDWLRDQLTFSNVKLLVEQLKRDIAAVESAEPNRLNHGAAKTEAGRRGHERAVMQP